MTFLHTTQTIHFMIKSKKTTKFRSFGSYKTAKRAEDRKNSLSLSYPDTEFFVKTKTWAGKDKKRYQVICITVKGRKNTTNIKAINVS